MKKLICRGCNADNPVDSDFCVNCGGNSFYKIGDTIDEVELAENESFEEYIARMDETQPYGVDCNNVAYLYPMLNNKPIAWRQKGKMVPRSDWGSLRRTGLGWKVLPTLAIALIFFLPVIVLKPLVYIFTYNSVDYAIQGLIQEIIVNAPYLIIVIFLTKLIGYAQLTLEDLLKPYGEKSESIKILFVNELEFFKFSENFFRKTYSMKWIKFGFVVFLAYGAYAVSWSITTFIDPTLFQTENIAPLPLWIIIFIFWQNLGIGLILFLLVTFLVAIGFGLFNIGNLGSDREKLSINLYKKMLKEVTNRITTAQMNTEAIADYKKELIPNGRTYYEFQRGNRQIGEFLFNIAAILIFICVSFGIGIYFFNLLKLLPEAYSGYVVIFSGGLTILGIMSLFIFILPQMKIHFFLKEFKLTLIDIFSEIASRFEYIYFEALVKPEVLKTIDEQWKSRVDLLQETQLMKDMVEEVKGYGTWSYDFPEVMKLILVALSTVIPITLSFIGM